MDASYHLGAGQQSAVGDLDAGELADSGDPVGAADDVESAGSSKHKVGAAFDLGVMFWGTPKIKVYSPDEDQWIRLSKEDVDDKDFHDAMNTLEKFTIYPVLNIRIYYNIF